MSSQNRLTNLELEGWPKMVDKDLGVLDCCMEGLDTTIAGRFTSGLQNYQQLKNFPKRTTRSTKAHATANDVIDEIGRLSFNIFPCLT